MKRLLLPLAIVLAGCMDPMAMLTDTEINRIGTIPVTVTPPILQYKPYPIRVEWHECDYDPHPVECDNVSWRLDPEALDTALVAGVMDAVAEWAAVLSPTPAEEYVVPRHNGWPWNCHGMEAYEPGDTLEAGFTLHVLMLIEDRKFGATGSTCGHHVWSTGENPKPPSGVIAFGKAFVERVIRDWDDPKEKFRETALHELGHVFMSSNRWYATRKWNEDRSEVWLEDPEAVAVFNRMGGANYPGRKVPATMNQHWACAAPDDIMGQGKRITDLTLSVLWKGLAAIPQGGSVSASDWQKKCPHLAADMSWHWKRPAFE